MKQKQNQKKILNILIVLCCLIVFSKYGLCDEYSFSVYLTKKIKQNIQKLDNISEGFNINYKELMKKQREVRNKILQTNTDEEKIGLAKKYFYFRAQQVYKQFELTSESERILKDTVKKMEKLKKRGKGYIFDEKEKKVLGKLMKGLAKVIGDIAAKDNSNRRNTIVKNLLINLDKYNKFIFSKKYKKFQIDDMILYLESIVAQLEISKKLLKEERDYLMALIYNLQGKEILLELNKIDVPGFSVSPEEINDRLEDDGEILDSIDIDNNLPVKNQNNDSLKDVGRY